MEDLPEPPMEDLPEPPMEDLPEPPMEDLPMEDLPTEPMEDLPTEPMEDLPTEPMEDLPTEPKIFNLRPRVLEDPRLQQSITKLKTSTKKKNVIRKLPESFYENEVDETSPSNEDNTFIDPETIAM